MKSTPKNPGTPARPASGRPARPTTANREANSRATQDFVRGVFTEMKRVTWPSRDEWVAATILTIVLVVGVGFFTYGVDFVLGWIFSFLTGGAR